MSYTALYREWRPKTFEDLIGQESTVRTLKNQIISGRIPHAYLFCGTRGTGKTSTAKLLSKAVNCLDINEGEPCNECEACREINNGTFIDVVEIDAASNTGVDNIRKLIEDVKYPPHNARYKIYI
jgi:DNA polymerase-3 subunit gamma/tau